MDLLTSPEFVDLTPNQVVPKLADMNIYKASASMGGGESVQLP